MYVNAKMMPVKTVSGIREGRMKESIRGSEFNYDIFAKKNAHYNFMFAFLH
jgi:hypothetical protein